MKVKILIAIIRIIITTWLVYEVYMESGVYTAIVITLIGFSVEMHSISIQAHLYTIKKLADHALGKSI